LKNLSKIIHYRVVEIIEQVFLEIKNYGHEEQRKKLIAGIVVTGGGAQLKHLKQLVEYITGMDTRIGFPNEHLAGDTAKETTSPIYSTAVGLLMKSISDQDQEDKKAVENTNEAQQPVNELETEDASVSIAEGQEEEIKTPSQEGKGSTGPRQSFFDRFVEKLKDILDKAE
jgi:cell division protein FtsA